MIFLFEFKDVKMKIKTVACSILLLSLANSVSAANLSSLKSCAQKSISTLGGFSVIDIRGSSYQAQIVLSDRAYDKVMQSEQSGGDMYDELAMALSIAKMCWAERDPSSNGIPVSIISSSGYKIVSSY